MRFEVIIFCSIDLLFINPPLKNYKPLNPLTLVLINHTFKYSIKKKVYNIESVVFIDVDIFEIDNLQLSNRKFVVL